MRLFGLRIPRRFLRGSQTKLLYTVIALACGVGAGVRDRPRQPRLLTLVAYMLAVALAARLEPAVALRYE